MELLMLYEPQDGPAPDPKTGPDTAVSLEIREVYTATLPFAMLLCLASLGLLVFGAGTCAVALWYWPPARATERPDFMRNPRLRAPAVRAVLGVGALLIAVAASWGVVAAATTHGMLPAPWLIGCSVALGCTGLLVLGAVGLWALHDPQQYHCPVCLDPVSRWRFVGTYAPAFFGEGRRRCKGHTDCVRCVRCRKPVRHSHWRHAPIHRLYHNHCWYAHCAEVSRDPTYAQRWAETHGAAVSDEELVHMLARAIDDSAFESIAGLIAMRSDLRTTPVAAEKGESALHIAARTGKVALLEVLFADLDRIDAEDCVVDADTGPSLAIAGLEGDHNDVYVCEPTVQYNGKPVYVGQAHGKYVYHYNARADPDGPEPFPDGWCVSKYLGNGSPPFRLLLDPPESTDAPIAAESLADPDSPVPAIRHAPYSLKNFGSWLAAVFARDISVPAAGTGNLLDDGVRGVTEYPCAEAGCRDITPEELQLQRLPHCLSVLQAAAASGAVEGVQYVIGRYKALHPRMLCWERFVEHGLWQPYPAPVQVQIANALERGDAQVTVDIGSNAEVVACCDARVAVCVWRCACGGVRVALSAQWLCLYPREMYCSRGSLVTVGAPVYSGLPEREVLAWAPVRVLRSRSEIPTPPHAQRHGYTHNAPATRTLPHAAHTQRGHTAGGGPIPKACFSNPCAVFASAEGTNATPPPDASVQHHRTPTATKPAPTPNPTLFFCSGAPRFSQPL